VGISLECVTEPDIDSDDWPAWHRHHWSMPYVDWLPVENRVLRWFQKHFRCNVTAPDAGGERVMSPKEADQAVAKAVLKLVQSNRAVVFTPHLKTIVSRSESPSVASNRGSSVDVGPHLSPATTRQTRGGESDGSIIK